MDFFTVICQNFTKGDCSFLILVVCLLTLIDNRRARHQDRDREAAKRFFADGRPKRIRQIPPRLPTNKKIG